jgi:hypothetical protein
MSGSNRSVCPISRLPPSGVRMKPPAHVPASCWRQAVTYYIGAEQIARRRSYNERISGALRIRLRLWRSREQRSRVEHAKTLDAAHLWQADPRHARCSSLSTSRRVRRYRSTTAKGEARGFDAKVRELSLLTLLACLGLGLAWAYEADYLAMFFAEAAALAGVEAVRRSM